MPSALLPFRPMRIVLQRVSRASVSIAGEVRGSVAQGFCVLAAFAPGDTSREVEWMAEKVAGLRVFPDEAGKMNRSLEEVGGAALVISQFTLYGNAEKGRRPSFVGAAPPAIAIPLYERFIAALRERGIPVSTGEFGAHMEVEIHNDGPVTLVLERGAE